MNLSDERPYSFELRMSNDYYQAFLTVVIYENTDVSISHDEVLDFLKSKNVVFGVDLDAVDTICQNPKHARDVLIAKGIPHMHGENSEIIFHIDSEQKIKPTILANGSVDFKNLNFITMAKKGDILAEKTIATEGTPGTTVTGKTIRQKPGKQVNFKIGKNVEISQDGLMIQSMVDGTIKMDGEKLSVIEVLEIKDDVGVKTGNIHFVGKVIVNGNITTGFEVVCDELEVNGIIESAVVKCTGNMNVKVGIQGNDIAKIECGGNFRAQFISNCFLLVKGKIDCDSIMHSEVICDEEINAIGKKGVIIGGDITARKSIKANVIGGEIGTITVLKLGLDSKLLEEYKTIGENLKEAKESATKLDQLVRLLNKNVQADPSNNDMQDMLNKTMITRDQSHLALTEVSAQMDAMMELLNELNDSYVRAGHYYPGVKVKIGNTFYNVKHDLRNTTLRKDSGQIVAIPY